MTKLLLDISALSDMNIHGIIKLVEISGNQDAINSVVLKKFYNDRLKGLAKLKGRA